MGNENQPQSERQRELQRLISSRIGVILLRYAVNDPINKLPVRLDTHADNISRILRSKKAIGIITSKMGVSKSDLDAFRKQWNDLEPLYPNQSKALKANHSSGIDFEGGERSKKVSLRIIVMESDKDLWAAINWFEKLPSEKLKSIIQKAYSEKE